MKKLILIVSLFQLVYSQGVRSINAQQQSTQRITTAYDDTASYFRWGASNGVHTLYIPYNLSPVADTSAIRVMNGLTASSQTFAIDTTYATSPVFVSSGSTHTLRFPMDRINNKIDTTIGMTKATTQIVTAPKYWTARQYMTSLNVDTVVARSNGGKLYILDSLRVGGNYAGAGSTADGYWSFSHSGSNASGIYSTAFADAEAIGDYSFALNGSRAEAEGSTAISNSRATGLNSVAISGAEANGDASVALASAWVQGRKSFGFGYGLITTSAFSAVFNLDSASRTINRDSIFGVYGGKLTIGALSPDSTLTDSGGAHIYGGALIEKNTVINNGFLDSDSIRDDGTTRATSGTWHSGLGAWSLGNITTGTINAGSSTITTTGAGSFGAVSGTTGTFSSTLSAVGKVGIGMLPSVTYALTLNIKKSLNPAVLIWDNSANNDNTTFGRIQFWGSTASPETLNPSTEIKFLRAGAAAIGDIVLSTRNSFALTSEGWRFTYDKLFKVDGTTFLDSNRNITAGTISSGTIISSGDVAVNGGDITSTATTFNLLNATVTTGNLFGAGTAVSIGAPTGTTTIKSDTTDIDRLRAEGVAFAIVSKTGDYTATTQDYTILVTCSSANITITLPSASANMGRIYNIKKMDATGYSVIIDGNASETIDGNTTITFGGQYTNYQIQCTGTGWVIL